MKNGGERGIRTLDTFARIHAFQACSFNHSDTSPKKHLAAPKASKIENTNIDKGGLTMLISHRNTENNKDNTKKVYAARLRNFNFIALSIVDQFFNHIIQQHQKHKNVLFIIYRQPLTR